MGISTIKDLSLPLYILFQDVVSLRVNPKLSAVTYRLAGATFCAPSIMLQLKGGVLQGHHYYPFPELDSI